MARLGWFTSQDGRSIHRIDDSGCLRTVNIGWDSVSVLRQWLIDAHQLAGVHRCGRVKNSLRCDDSRCARGVQEGSTRYALGRAPASAKGHVFCQMPLPRARAQQAACDMGLSPRQGLAQPGDRAAERLFAAPISEWPRAPPSIDELIGDISEHCHKLLCKLPPMAVRLKALGATLLSPLT